MTDDEGYLLAQYFSRIQKLWLILKFGIKFVFVTLLAAKNKNVLFSNGQFAVKCEKSHLLTAPKSTLISNS